MPTRTRLSIAALVVATGTGATIALAPHADAVRPLGGSQRLDIATRAATRAPVLLRSIDAAALEDHDGWSADDGYLGGMPDPQVANPTTADNEAPASVLSTNRSGDHFSYTLRRLVPGVQYTVRLHFVEDYFTAADQRLFDVTVNGASALAGFDVFATAGGKGVPVHRDATATATAEGRIVVDLKSVKSGAILAGLQLLGPAPANRLGSYAKPQDVTATATGPTSTVLTWTTVPGIAQYAVLRDGAEVGRTGAGAFVDGKAVPGRTHRYVVAPVNPNGRFGLQSGVLKVQMPAATPTATGRYRTFGSLILDPNGKPFVPLGANLGTAGMMNWAGSAEGHAKDAKVWGWNTVRLLLNPHYVDDVALRSLVAEYRAAGIVCILDAHHEWNAWDENGPAWQEETRQMWTKIAPMFADDSGVWFNLANEPGYINDEWYEFNASIAATIRGTGAKNILVADSPSWGQDIGSVAPYYIGNRYAYTAPMAPRLQATFGDVVLGQHNYGAKYTTAQMYGDYVDTVHAQGLPLVANEFGYSIDGVTAAGSWYLNREGSRSVFTVAPGKGVGMIAWNGNVGDRFSLKQDNSPFWKGEPTEGLSDLGKDLWAAGHAQR